MIRVQPGASLATMVLSCLGHGTIRTNRTNSCRDASSDVVLSVLSILSGVQAQVTAIRETTR